MGFFTRYLLARLNEISTVRGIVALISGVAGWNLSQTQTEAIVSVALAIMGVLAAFFPDRIKGRSRVTDRGREGDDPGMFNYRDYHQLPQPAPIESDPELSHDSDPALAGESESESAPEVLKMEVPPSAHSKPRPDSSRSTGWGDKY